MAESKYITEEDYFICSDGIMPARLKSNQILTKQQNKNNYITVEHTSTHSLGDFVCRWAMVLAAAIATLVVLSGGAALSLLLVAGAAAAGAAGGALLCGHLMAAGRKSDNSSQLYIIAGFNTVDAKLMMHCKIGGMIRVAPGCNSFWKACVIGAKNFVFAGLEGIAVGATIYYGGRMIASGSFSQFLPNLAKNYGYTWTKPLGLVGRGIGGLNKAFDNYFVEGLEGTEAWEDAWKGALVVEMPLYNVASNAVDPEKSNRWQDYYYAGLTIGSLGLIPPKQFEDANTRFVNGLKNVAKKLSRFFNWTKEKTSTVYRTQGGELPNASQERIIIDENGNIKVRGNDMLYVTIDDKKHQIYFYNKRGGSAKGAEVVSFEIPESLANEIRNNAVPQSEGRSNPGSPQISDPTKSDGAYGLPKDYINKIREQAIPGTGKKEQP